jgi:uncharacterized membrane protein YdbT with pleckstrin-like domain
LRSCPHCDAPLSTPAPAICPACGGSLGDPPRREVKVTAPSPERTLFEGSPAAIGTVWELAIVILTLGLAAIYFVVRARGTLYKVTTTRVVVETGLANKKIEQVDLYRVVDFAVLLPLTQRLVGTGTLLLETEDRTTREVRLERIRADVRKLYEELRSARDAERARRGVTTMDRV